MQTTNTKGIEDLYRNYGLACSIDAGPFGLVVYAASPAKVSAVVGGLDRAIRAKGIDTKTTVPAEEKDEPEDTRYWARIDFDWEKFAK